MNLHMHITTIKTPQTLKNIKKQQGMNVLELMIVLVIIGILVALSIPVYERYLVKLKYTTAIQQLDADSRAVINYAIVHSYSYADISDGDHTADEINNLFGLDHTDGINYLSKRTGNKQSDFDFLLYQHIDKEKINAPAEAPQIVAMATVITENKGFIFDCHYYNSDFGGWDYPEGQKYVSLDCNGFVSISDIEVIVESDDSSSDESSSDDSSSDDSSSDDSSSDDSSSDDSSSDDSSSDDSSSDDSDADSGSGAKGNNGHGNNEDGVDSSNPGKGHHKHDASCTRNTCVDDEKQKGKK